MSRSKSPDASTRLRTFHLRLTPRQYPFMRALVLHGAFIGVEALERYDNGVPRSLFERKFIETIGSEGKRRLAATEDGRRAFELYHRGEIATRKDSGDITEFVRLMLKLKNGAKG